MKATSSSRTVNSIRNIKYALLGQIISIILSLVGRTVFVYVLGKEYLGINGLFSNILAILALAEMGIGSAVIYSLYKPLADNDEKLIIALMRLFRKVYTGIGTLRVLTAGNQPSLVIINPVFYYDSGDLEFFEELQRKRARLEQIVRDWVSSNTASYFLETSDEKLRSDLAGLLSEILILGSVENHYFNEFLVVDGNL